MTDPRFIGLENIDHVEEMSDLITVEMCRKVYYNGNPTLDMAEIATSLNAQIKPKLDKLEAEVERLRMQLAACDVIARANTKDSAARTREGIHPDYMSPTLQSVMQTVDCEIDLRAEVERLETMVRWARADSEALNIENKRYKAALEEIVEILNYDCVGGCEEANKTAKKALGGD